MNTKDFLKSPFMTFCVAMLILLAYPLIVFPKGEMVLLVNRYHTPFLDFFFKYTTHLGDGLSLAILLVIVLFYSYKVSIVVTFSIIVQSILVSIFKRWLYAGLPRPTAYFGDDIPWNLVEGVQVHTTNTFPSGHATTAFALFALLFVILNKQHYLSAILFFIFALIAGFSRIYLLQHFLVDVYAGAILGLISVLSGMLAAEKFFSTTLLEKMHKNSLRTLMRKS